MGLEKYAPPIIIINGIPVSLIKGTCEIVSVEQQTRGQVSVVGYGAFENKVYYLGSSIDGIIQTNANPIIRKNLLFTSFSIDCNIVNTGLGVIITDALLPLLNLARRALDIPCQFIWGGYYMMLGYLDSYNNSYSPDKSIINLKMSFTENIYKTFSNESMSEFSGTVSAPNIGALP